MKKIQTGVYQISPEIMLKGSDHKKQLLLNYYDDEALKKDLAQPPQEQQPQDQEDDEPLPGQERLAV